MKDEPADSRCSASCVNLAEALLYLSLGSERACQTDNDRLADVSVLSGKCRDCSSSSREPVF